MIRWIWIILMLVNIDLHEVGIIDVSMLLVLTYLVSLICLGLSIKSDLSDIIKSQKTSDKRSQETHEERIEK